MKSAAVVVASNRAAAGIYQDTTGPLIVQALTAWGFTVEGLRVVGDGLPVAEAVRAAVADGALVVITTGGTGINPTDRTPDVIAPLLDSQLPGIAEAIRAHGVAKGVATASLSRGIAGVVEGCLVVNLPGSRGGVEDGLEVLAKLVPHAVEQLAGGDHA